MTRAASAAAAITREGAVEAARADPACFVSLMLGQPAAPLQCELIDHALTHIDWYAELPRGHMKTSTMVFFAAWWLGVRPETRLKIISQTDEYVGKTSAMLRAVVRSRPYRAVFPEIRVVKNDDAMMSWSIGVRGLPPRRDSSVHAAGVFGRTGGRADIEWFDDICDLRNSVLQPKVREQVKEAVANIWEPMLDPSGQHAPRIWRTGTPFHVADLSATWRQVHAEQGSLLRRPCIGTKSPWPDKFTPDYLARIRKRMGPMAYARAYELEPIDPERLLFREQWFRYYRASAMPKTTRVICALDWAFTKKAMEQEDPDYSIVLIGEVDFLRNLYLTDVLRVRETFPDFAKMARDLASRRGVSVVKAEANGPQKGIFDSFRAMSQLPMMVSERSTDKYSRASGAQPFVQSGKLFFPTDDDGKLLPAFQPVVDELKVFPGAHDDTVDTVVDLIEEATRGTLTSIEKTPPRIIKPTAEQRIWGSATGRRSIFGA